MKLRKLSALLCTAALLLSALPAALAADADTYTDAADIQHWEAVAALSKLEVIGGKDDGAFDPEGTLTRAEAAKLITLIMLGGTELVNEDQSPAAEADAPIFTDVQEHWAEDYIQFCFGMGILSGRGNGAFDPDAQVTGLEVCKMALAALGYDPAAYALTGPRWAEKTDELARYTGLYQGLDAVVITGPISRDNAAQILCNTLQATPKMVAPTPDPDGNVSWQYKDATRKDGTPSTLLWERFQLEEVGELPAQPAKK